MKPFAPMLANPDVELNPQQYFLLYAARQYLIDTFQGRMPVYEAGFFHHSNIDPWPYRTWSKEPARELFNQGWLIAGNYYDTNEPYARWVRLNLNRCSYGYVGAALFFRVGSAWLTTDYVRYDINEILEALNYQI